MLEAEESTPRRCCKELAEKGKPGVVGDSGFGWEIWRGVALGESDGVGVPEDPKVMICRGSRCGLSFSLRGSMPRAREEGGCRGGG